MSPEQIEEPSKELKTRHQIFFFRLSLAKLINKFSSAKAMNNVQSPVNFFVVLEELPEKISDLKSSIPIEWRPEHDIFTEPTEHLDVIALHLEYYTFQILISIARGTLAKITRQHNLHKNAPIDLEEVKTKGSTSYITSARKMLQILGGIMNSDQLNPAVKWL
jgi:hypothetical protein